MEIQTATLATHPKGRDVGTHRAKFFGLNAPEMIRLRRAIHQHPEVGWQETRTTSLVAETLRSRGLTPIVRKAGTGLIVEVGTGDPVVGFRADIDALTVQEENSIPYRSTVPGVMHACGHDAHTAIGVGIAEVLNRLPEMPGTVRLIFQPAEEQLPSGETTGKPKSK